MFDLEAAVRGWRSLAREYPLSTTDLDELEDHLRSTYLAHRTQGRRAVEAWAIALRALGTAEELSSEYRKVRGQTWLWLLRAGWVAFVVAFFLPVADGGITLLDPELAEGLLPGFQAFRVAITGEEGIVGVLSAVTNVLMLVTMWRATALGRKGVVLLGIVVSVSALLNGWWLSVMDPVADLRIGYYMWWVSFGLVSSALLMRARVLAQSSVRVLLA